MEGREYVVVPMVILTEGVHAGSGGPLYYPKDELSKTPVAWNHKPIVVYHPEMNGVGISACDPTVISNRKVGVMMNTTFEKGRLKSEAWIEKSRADAVDARIMAAVERNEMMELSTGVFIDVEEDTGKWGNEDYQGIARNYRPDHLALLPDKIGACSIKDGAGFLRNEAESNKELLITLQKALVKAGIMQGNEMSFSNIQGSLRTALSDKFKANNDAGPYLFVEDVYPTFVVYEFQGKLYRLGYSATDAGVALSEDAPVEVVRVTEYRTVQGTFVGNKDTTQPDTTIMEKKKIVDAIVSNAKSAWKEEDREKLMALNDEQLTAIQKSLEEPKAPAPASEAAKPEVNQKKDEKQDSTPTPKVTTMEEFIAQAPQPMQEVLTNSLAIYAEEKQKLIATITANKNNSFTKEQLEGRPLGELKAIARLAAGDAPQENAFAPNYAGMAPVPTGNQGEEPLALPTMNFEKKAGA